jgi:hypothetical protein
VQRKRERPAEVILLEALVIGDDSQSTAKSQVCPDLLLLSLVLSAGEAGPARRLG